MGRLPKAHWLGQSWGSLRLDPHQDLPDGWAKSSRERFRLDCSCGRTVTPIFSNVGNGLQASCGRCAWEGKAAWLTRSWGGLRLVDDGSLPEEWGPFSEQKVRVRCSCGGENTVRFVDVNKHGTGSCGKCGHRTKEAWLSRTYGKLRRLEGQDGLPDSWGPGSSRTMLFACSCGKQKRLGFNRVQSGHVRTCGDCLAHGKDYWLAQRWGCLVLDPEQPLPDAWGSGSNRKFWVVCDCASKVPVNFYDLTLGKTRSCGCRRLGAHESSPAIEIHRYLLSLAPDAKAGAWFRTPDGRRMEYDVYVPSRRLAVEYHGLRWHSEKFKAGMDYEKFLVATSMGDRLVQVYADEWRTKRQVVEGLLRSILAPAGGKRTKPSYRATDGVSAEALEFLDRHHYLGGSSGFLAVEARWRGRMVGVWVFKKRNSSTAVWHRAVWDHGYRAWNPHQRALNVALPLLRAAGVRTLLTFSDNRLHTGGMYAKLGFRYEADVPPNYYYTDGRSRKTKYALRVPAGTDERERARRLGWYRIWDSGKKRFSLSLAND